MDKSIGKKISIIIFWIIVWQLVSLAVGNSLLFASPLDTILSLVTLVVTGNFWNAIAGSFLRILIGFLLGAGMACLVAGIAAKYRFVEQLFSPLLRLLKAMPLASFVVMLLIWFRAEYLSVAVCFLMVFPILYINMLEGLQNTDKGLMEMAQVFHMPGKNIFFYIKRPALKPFVESGLKLALGLCWKAGIAAELIGTPAYSIGERLYLSKIYMDTAGVFAWTTVVILLSLLFEKGMQKLSAWFFAWQPKMAVPDIPPAQVKQINKIKQIEIKHLTKSYNDLTVLNDENHIYESGKLYEINSPSGSGKTTLFRLLTGLEKPDKGEITENIRFSYLFQEDRLCEEYTAVQNVAMVTGDEKKAYEVLAEMLPKESLNKPCSQLSGGMKRRVALVRAMEADSDCVLLDEPFTGQDLENRKLMEGYLAKQKGNRIIIMASHI